MQDEIQSLEEDSEVIWVAKGYLALFSSKNNYRQAREAFNAAMDVTQNKSYAANLGLGNIQFLQDDFKAAGLVESFEVVPSVLTRCAYVYGTHVPEVEKFRVGRKMLRTCAEAGSKNSDALTSLAMMKMANEKDEGILK